MWKKEPPTTPRATTANDGDETANKEDSNEKRWGKKTKATKPVDGGIKKYMS